MRVLVALLTAVALTACAGAEQNGQSEEARRDAEPEAGLSAADLEPMEPFDTAEVRLIAEDGEATSMPVYVADDAAARRQGLMGVDDLPREAGMVFLYADDNEGGFWMKDTLIPLSIAFFDADGQVLAVLDMEPCEADPCPSYDPGVAYRGALEVNEGRFEELGLDEPGWRISLASPTS